MGFFKKIAISIYSGIVSYFLIAPIFGERGLLNYKKLEKNIELIKNNLENLKEIQKSLKSRYINLRISKTEIYKEANKMQYYPKNSIVIKFKKNQEKQKYYQGKIVEAENFKNQEDKNFYIISIVIIFISYFTLSYIHSIKKELLKRNKN